MGPAPFPSHRRRHSVNKYHVAVSREVPRKMIWVLFSHCMGNVAAVTVFPTLAKDPQLHKLYNHVKDRYWQYK
jgi:hypothetical protein